MSVVMTREAAAGAAPAEGTVAGTVSPAAGAARADAGGRGMWVRVVGEWSWLRVVTVLAMVAGVGVFTYPEAANWFNDRVHASQLHSYVDAVTRLPDAELEAAVQAARDYNALLPNGPLRDPYALDAAGNPVPIGEGKDAYERTLRFEERGMMGELLIPKIGVHLPIFHDTDETSLDAGVGHLYGSALPVGGENTHSVLTAHSGIPGATLFTDLNKLRKNDQFQVVVAGETLTYEVDQILRVLPSELDALRQIPGGDYVTLVTCTPIGVNTHRLLVRGHRIPTPEDALPGAENAGGAGAGVPWWPYPVPAALLGMVAVTRGWKHTQHPSTLASGGGRPTVAVMWRPYGSGELRAWERHRRRALGRDRRTLTGTQLLTTRGTSAGAGVRKIVRGDGGAHTWSVLVGGSPVAVSAYAYATPDAAVRDAQTAIAGQVMVGVRARKRGRVFWVLGVDRTPVLIGAIPHPDTGEATRAGQEAVRLLAHAHHPDAPGDSGDESAGVA